MHHKTKPNQTLILLKVDCYAIKISQSINHVQWIDWNATVRTKTIKKEKHNIFLPILG